jgi:transcriptional regulator with GAF, ATPase, and Fis domain
LSLRCQVLLAGSSWLLDSTDVGFAQELHRLLVGLLQANVGRRSEEERVKCVMKQLGSVGESRAILGVFQTVLRISRLSDLPVLITCSAISLGLAESELFGHRRGAFTGADRERKGLIRAATRLGA